MTIKFILAQAINLSVIFLVNYITGLLVEKRNLKVNYSRKINHFCLFFIPVFISIFINYSENILSQIIGFILETALIVILAKPFRERSKVLNTMFASFDRPEDRPYTLLWLITQSMAGYIILVLLGYYFNYIGKSELILIPVLINGIGDGLAEPIGVRFGKHKYRTKGLFCKRYYERSVEGSLCVFIVSILTVVLFFSSFSGLQFLLALLILPPVMTLAEALAPHTWDTPFLFLTAGLALGILLLL